MSSYIDTYGPLCIGPGRIVLICTHSWRDHTERNLAWHYPDRVAAMMAGNDPAAQSDLGRWAKLGRRDAA